ncbi:MULTISPECIES: ATP-binding protein [Mycobacteriaceae]|uniref:Serine/threonine protein kinase n=1 Tax=Mycolicibacterium neoaurum VKM Ac-1815D TaxID=700508 RepID=V5X9C5_MYCNE|nr:MULTISPECIES: ATP-binding protein [Mycobacteriaceae]AHC25035.1 anti-sigma regulatory factor [Mycolicibacterium neoaurum VKM Ac-1815D]AMO05559.1 anti-sigma regulatory factor [Mycolicibacterium neoaurum]AXK76122.1 ATP-binding protein [Mycolicibacterium neoaurum]KJQ50600.1 anti-sigma regulatory factor [Mycolicibacterium neoaurum]KUM09779.1 anti-sigma regulatory factor [Mycolicibacterium neoaurum]
MTTPERFVLDTLTGPDTLTAIQQTLDALWSEHPELPDMVRLHMDLAAGEIGANIIEHSGDGNPVHLRMTVELSSCAVRAIFTDDGHPAPFDVHQPRMPDEMSESGRGLAIAHRVLDELSYRRDHIGNHWTLIRNVTE